MKTNRSFAGPTNAARISKVIPRLFEAGTLGGSLSSKIVQSITFNFPDDFGEDAVGIVGTCSLPSRPRAGGGLATRYTPSPIDVSAISVVSTLSSLSVLREASWGNLCCTHRSRPYNEVVAESPAHRRMMAYLWPAKPQRQRNRPDARSFSARTISVARSSQPASAASAISFWSLGTKAQQSL